ncbi:MAG: L-threonylcarbamoyladenylate synthase [Candidatus Saccharimonadales bacterium]
MIVPELLSVIEKINKGAVGVLPTDTVYGLVAAANQPAAIERIYALKGRDASKPFIILISDIRQLEMFDIALRSLQIEKLAELWKEPVSVILPCNNNAFEYLHRGQRSLAFRIPQVHWLKVLLATTGPIVATSANVSGQPIFRDINEISKQLPGLDFYIEGPTSEEPSRLARLHNDGSVKWLQRA